MTLAGEVSLQGGRPLYKVVDAVEHGSMEGK